MIKLVPLLLVAALLVAGCGGSSDSTASSPVTKAEFIRKADLICGRADLEQPHEFEAFTAKYERELERMLPVRYDVTLTRDLTLPSVKKQIKEIESLRVPEGEAKKVGAIIAGFKAAVKRGEQNPYFVQRWDLPARDPFARANRIAARYGFYDCEELR